MKTFSTPINYKALAKKTGVKKGNIFKSTMLNEWVISGHPEIDQIIIEPPHKEGDIIGNKKVTFVKIKNNHWVFEYEFYLTNIELTIINDTMYRIQGKSAIFTQIQDYLAKNTYKHKSIVTMIYTDELEDFIEAATQTKLTKDWRPIAATLKHSDKDDPLSKKIYAHIRNCKDKQSIAIALTVEELETILDL